MAIFWAIVVGALCFACVGFIIGMVAAEVELPFTALGRAKRARKFEIRARAVIYIRAGFDPGQAEKRAEAELAREAAQIVADL